MHFSRSVDLISHAVLNYFVLLLLVSQNLLFIRTAAADDALYALIGKNDALLVTDNTGAIILEKNADKQLIPASTLKLMTALTALHILGKDYRFPTEFYAGADGNLRIKGYGDPLLISETLPEIAAKIGRRLKRINRIILDDSYFAEAPIVPGAAPNSIQPYDAPIGALSVNFNTVLFEKDPDTGGYVSGEPQTPLLPFVKSRVKSAGIPKGRIILAAKNHEAALYAGYMFKYFFSQAGIKTGPVVVMDKTQSLPGDLIYRHYSPYSMDTVIAKLLYYSNNFIANQLLIAAGAKRYGPPGNLAKGVQAMQEAAKKTIGIDKLTVTEGSGISRKNRVSARTLEKILAAFETHRNLMRRENGQYYKTGTLSGIQTRVGYIEGKNGRLYRFVIMVNTKGKSSRSIVSRLVARLK